MAGASTTSTLALLVGILAVVFAGMQAFMQADQWRHNPDRYRPSRRAKVGFIVTGVVIVIALGAYLGGGTKRHPSHTTTGPASSASVTSTGAVTSPRSTAAGVSTAAASNPPGVATLAKWALSSHDVPVGWTAADPSGYSPMLPDGFEICTGSGSGSELSSISADGQFASDPFDYTVEPGGPGTEDFVGSVTSFYSAADASAYLQALRSGISACPSYTQDGPKALPAPGVGTDSIAFSEGNVAYEGNIVVARSGRIVTTLADVSDVAPTQTRLVADLSRIMVSRIPADA